jgi:hypothetical protein
LFGNVATKPSPTGAGKANSDGVDQENQQHSKCYKDNLPNARGDERYHSQKKASDSGDPIELFVESPGKLNPAIRTSHACPATDPPDAPRDEAMATVWATGGTSKDVHAMHQRLGSGTARSEHPAWNESVIAPLPGAAWFSDVMV